VSARSTGMFVCANAGVFSSLVCLRTQKSAPQH